MVKLKRELTVEKRAEICTLRKECYSLRQIAKKVNVSYGGVVRTLERKKDTGLCTTRRRSGRPRITTVREDINIVTISKRNRFLTAPAIVAEINRDCTTPIGVSTVKNRLNAAGLRGCVAKRKPLLREVNRRKRLKWIYAHKDWSIEQWKSVLWTDESKFEKLGTKRRVFVRRLANEAYNFQCVLPSVKHGGGSIMVWGCFG